MECIDLSEALKATDGDIELLREVVDAFLEEYPNLLIELESALPTGKHDIVQRASHTINGSLRLFGNVPARSLAERLEEMGAAGTLGDAAETLASLRDSLELLRRQLVKAMVELSDGSL